MKLQDSSTPLYTVSENGNEDIVELLEHYYVSWLAAPAVNLHDTSTILT